MTTEERRKAIAEVLRPSLPFLAPGAEGERATRLLRDADEATINYWWQVYPGFGRDWRAEGRREAEARAATATKGQP